MYGKGGGEIGTVPPANRPPQKHEIQVPKSKEKAYPKNSYFPQREGKWGQLEIRQEGQRGKAEWLKTNQNERRNESHGEEKEDEVG